MVIVDLIIKRRQVIEQMESHYVSTSNVPGTQKNYESRCNRYIDFCDFTKMRPYPANEFKICKYAAFLAETMKTVESIKQYCGAICQENEMKGFRPVKLGIKFHKEIMGIRKNLHHQFKRAEPMMVELLTKMQAVIDFTEDKNVAVWTCMLTGFHLVLRKSNLVPLSKMHDTVRNISRNNVRYDQGLMIVYVDWSKTNQYRELVNKSPMMGNNNYPICSVRWIKYMCDRIPAKPYHNLFCYKNKKGQIL